jgi:hypothetical protein
LRQADFEELLLTETVRGLQDQKDVIDLCASGDVFPDQA